MLRLLPELDVFGEVELGPAAAEAECGFVVCTGCGLGRLECAEPDAGGFVGVADFGSPLAPWTLPDSTVSPLGGRRGGGGGWWGS